MLKHGLMDLLTIDEGSVGRLVVGNCVGSVGILNELGMHSGKRTVIDDDVVALAASNRDLRFLKFVNGFFGIGDLDSELCHMGGSVGSDSLKGKSGIVDNLDFGFPDLDLHSTKSRKSSPALLMTHRFVHSRRVEFADTDLAGIMHFSNFFKFMEVSEHAFYRSLGFSVHDFRPKPDAPAIGWPRVHASADFRLPIRFEDEIAVELLIERIGNKSISYVFHFWTPSKQLAATGKFTVACVQFGEGDAPMKAVQIPEEVRSKISEAPAELLETPKKS